MDWEERESEKVSKKGESASFSLRLGANRKVPIRKRHKKRDRKFAVEQPFAIAFCISLPTYRDTNTC